MPTSADVLRQLLERDMRVFMTSFIQDVGRERAVVLATEVNSTAARLSGEPDSKAWFTAWAIVLKEKGTATEEEAAIKAMSLVKKLWDAGM